jgi:uncharacterized protein (UPF0332 family)
MKRVDFLKKKIAGYLKKEQLFKDEEYKKLERSYQAKARKSFTVANLQFKISDEENVKKMLNLTSEFEMFDWVIIAAYYAMYTSALAALAKLGFKSKSHAATIAILQHYYLEQKENMDKTKRLEQNDIHKLVKAHAMSEQFIAKLIQTKSRRETAQYDATPSITKEMAKTSLNDADEFITKIEEILG